MQLLSSSLANLAEDGGVWAGAFGVYSSGGFWGQGLRVQEVQDRRRNVNQNYPAALLQESVADMPTHAHEGQVRFFAGPACLTC